jgi:hypothetical protein
MSGAQKYKKDSQVVSLFTLLGSVIAKASCKYVGEIDPCTQVMTWHKRIGAYGLLFLAGEVREKTRKEFIYFEQASRQVERQTYV